MKDWIRVSFGPDRFSWDNLAACEEWLETHVGAQGEDTWNWYLGSADMNYRTIMIRRHDDALAFRLTFGL